MALTEHLVSQATQAFLAFQVSAALPAVLVFQATVASLATAELSEHRVSPVSLALVASAAFLALVVPVSLDTVDFQVAASADSQDSLDLADLAVVAALPSLTTPQQPPTCSQPL